MVAKGCLATPLFFFSQIFFLKFLINFLKIFLFFYAKTRVNPQGLTPGRAISFWTENLIEVLIWFFPKMEVSSIMRIET